MDDTPQEIHRSGHRCFVGGTAATWDEVGELQFRFLVDRGLMPSDVFVDVACGALRGGMKFIEYLEPRRYLGIDRHIELIIYGVASELGLGTFREKQPRFVVSDSFEFHKFGAQPRFGIAQSLFTHLCAADVETCLRNLNNVAERGCRFFATFFETSDPAANPAVSHSHGYFAYTRTQAEDFGTRTGWEPRYIGEWNHPRAQKMIEYRAV